MRWRRVPIQMSGIAVIGLATLPLLALTLSAQSDPDIGLIEGRVVDSAEAPVKGAKVHAQPPGATGAVVRFVITDDNGRFQIDRLPFALYRVYALKEADGYPDTRWFPTGPAPEVTISSNHPAGTVLVRFGPKAGVLTGTVRDGVTGKPLNSFFSLTRVTDAWRMSTSMPPDYRAFVPPSTEVSITISAHGYQSWHYTSLSDGSNLRIESGSELHREIKLTPIPDPNQAAKILIPEGYRGRLRLQCEFADEAGVPKEGGALVYRVTDSSDFRTSSRCPMPGPDNHYFYYSADGSIRAVPDNYWMGNGLIWGEYNGYRGGALHEFGFFVGTEAEYRKAFPPIVDIDIRIP
jgi:Carboxypeptidase regulatory-like domain